MIIQGSNRPLILVLASDISASTAVEVDLSQHGTSFKHWSLADVTVSGKTITCPLTEEETLEFPSGRCDLEAKYRIGESNWIAKAASVVVGKRNDHTSLGGGASSETASDTAEYARILTDVALIESYSPYIGENGNWYEFNADTNAFVDTGVTAKGETGATGEKGDKGDKGDPGDVTDEYKALAAQMKGNAESVSKSVTTAKNYAASASDYASAASAYATTSSINAQTSSTKANEAKSYANEANASAVSAATSMNVATAKASEASASAEAAAQSAEQAHADVSEETARAKAAEKVNADAISATKQSLEAEATAREEADTTLQTAIDGKQDKLTAGTNITIENNVISATGGGGSVEDKQFELIDTITLTEDTNQITMTSTTSGESLNNYQKLLFEIAVAVGAKSAQGVFKLAGSSNNISALITAFLYTQKKYTCATVTKTGGFIMFEYYCATSLGLASVLYGSRIKDDTISSITFGCYNSSYNMPTGTVINIYGVKA